MSYDLPWANVSNGPFRLFKHWVHEGGISTSLIMHWPAGLKQSGVVHAPCHVVDILPTLLDAAGVAYPAELAGQALGPPAADYLGAPGQCRHPRRLFRAGGEIQPTVGVA